MLIAQLRHIRNRRNNLKSAINVDSAYEQWKESCVPSYCHSNLAAAYVSWARLFVAISLMRATAQKPRRVLDFGASVGELGHLLDDDIEYHFVEQDDAATSILLGEHSSAVRQTLSGSLAASYDCVFAIDALEHNENFAEILGALSQLLTPKGVLILSGPTENAIYRLGRRIVGFEGDYHATTIYEIEVAAARNLERLKLAIVPFCLPLFRVSAWGRR